MASLAPAKNDKVFAGEFVDNPKPKDYFGWIKLPIQDYPINIPLTWPYPLINI